MFINALDDPRKTDHLLALDGAMERLHLFEADLIEEGSFDSVVNGCDGVFHTASPVSLSVTDPQVQILFICLCFRVILGAHNVHKKFVKK